MIRTSRDYAAAMGIEPAWNRPPASFREVRLMAEDLRLVGAYERRRSLAEPALTASPRLVRTHVEGAVAVTASAAAMTRFLPFIIGGDWVAAPRGGRLLRADGAADPASMTLWRRLAPGDDWQQFSGLRARSLRLAPGGDGGLVMALQLVGAERGAKPKAAVLPDGPAAAPLRLLPRGGIGLAAAGGTPAEDGLVAAGFAIAFQRPDVRPHFGLAATAPQIIPPGTLGAAVEIRLLANDAARRATAPEVLAARFGFVDAGLRRDIVFPRLVVTDRRDSVEAGGGPAQVQIRAEAELQDGVLMTATERTAR